MDVEAVVTHVQNSLRSRRVSDLLALGRSLVADAPERSEGWLLQSLGLILDDQARLVYRRILPLRRRRFGDDGLVFLKDVFLILARLKAYDAILAAALVAPTSELFTVIPHYFAACVLLRQRRFDEGFALLSGVRGCCLANLDALPTTDSDGFMVLFRHALLVNDAGYLQQPYYRENLALNQARLGPLRWAAAPEPGADFERSVVMVSCDGRYAELFLPCFLASADRLCADRVLHLHLLDPDSEPPPLSMLPSRQYGPLALTWEQSSELKCAAYYASARFVRMAALLRHYQRPILLFDVDMELHHPLEQLERAMEGADFGSFRRDRLDPGSVYPAAAVGFRPTPAGLELADLLGNLILSKMSLKRPLLWLIDQASLYAAVTLLADQAGRLRVADFNHHLGMSLEDYVSLRGRDEDKLRLMTEASV